MVDVLVFGAGLIGASIGLALRDDPDYRVLLHDVVPATTDTAVLRGAGRTWDGNQAVDLLVVAAPPAGIPGVLLEVQGLHIAQTYTHVSSVQSQVQREVEAAGLDVSTIVGSHPLAGKEQSGPTAASADLFLGRPWALCPSEHTTPGALQAVRRLVEACGAVPLEVSPSEHDAAVALLSHLPQVVSSALAALLVERTPGTAGAPVRTELSGAGLVDTTRLAGSDPALWTQILAANAAHVAPELRSLTRLLDALAQQLDRLSRGLDPDAVAALSALLERGHRGRAQVPVKRGVRDEAFGRVAVDVDDRPGRLAALLTAAGDAGVNVEDVHVDHLPGRPTGVIELLVRTGAATALAAELRRAGWSVRGGEEIKG